MLDNKPLLVFSILLHSLGKMECFEYNIKLHGQMLTSLWWYRQLSVLSGHPNVLAFVSHGGLLGTLEAAYNGVPVVGIPFYGDQRTNVAHLKARGMAIQLHYKNITKQSLLEALRTVLDQPR